MHNASGDTGLPPRKVGKRGHVLRWIVIVVSIGILIHVIGLALPGIQDAAAALRDVDPLLVVMALGLELVSNAALVQLYRSTIVAVGHDISYRHALPVSMGGFSVSRLFPGGATTAAVFMSRALAGAGVPRAKATGGVVVAGTLGMVVLGAIVSIGALGSLVRGRLPVAYVISIFVVVSIFLVIAFIGLRMLKSTKTRERVLRGVEAIITRVGRGDVGLVNSFVDDLAGSLPSLGLLLRPALWSAVNWSTDVAALWLLFFAFGEPVNLGVVIVAYGVANLLTALPHVPGGLGVAEAGLAGTFAAFDVEPAVAIVVVLGYRLISYWIPALAGLVPYFKEIGRRRSANPRGETA